MEASLEINNFYIFILFDLRNKQKCVTVVNMSFDLSCLTTIGSIIDISNIFYYCKNSFLHCI